MRTIYLFILIIYENCAQLQLLLLPFCQKLENHQDLGHIFKFFQMSRYLLNVFMLILYIVNPI